MKKRLFIIIPIAVVFILVFSLMIFGAVGTFSWFADQEVSNGNILTAGTLDLKVDNLDGAIIHIVRTNIKPYAPWSHSYGGQWILKNAGSLPGKFTVQIINIKNYENGINDPEGKAGDVTGGTGSDQGELGSQMYGKWMENHYGIYSPAKGWAGSAVFNPINTANGVIIDGIVLQPGDIFSAYLDLEFDTQAGTINNLTQSDSLEFDIVFRLEQIQTP